VTAALQASAHFWVWVWGGEICWHASGAQRPRVPIDVRRLWINVEADGCRRVGAPGLQGPSVVGRVPLRGGSRIAAGGLGDALLPFEGRNIDGLCLADLFEPGEVPEVWKVPALLGFHRLDATIGPIQKDAGAVGLVGQGKSGALGVDPCVLRDERLLGHSEMEGHPGEFFVRERDLPGPAAAGGATIALPEDGHGNRRWELG
jgi:hypothetical protein